MSYFPIRCFTCGKVIANLYKVYEDNKDSIGLGPTMDKMGLKRPCCRMTVMGYTDFEKTIFEEPKNNLDEK